MNRSYLMVAGDKQKHLSKLDRLNTDFATVNLEDGVFDKDFARNLVIKNLSNKNNDKIIVRVNSFDSCGRKDIEMINKIKPFAIRIPKVKSLNESLEGAEIALNLSDKKLTQLKNIFEEQNKTNIQNNLQRIYDLDDSVKGIAVTGLIVPIIGVATLIAYSNKETENYCKNIQNTISLEKKVFGKTVSINDEMKQLHQTRCIDKQQETKK